MTNCRMRKPWQVTIDYHKAIGYLVLRVREHTHASIAFSNDAIRHCCGAVEEDDDGYTIRCLDEPAIVEVAREIARMSELKEADKQPDTQSSTRWIVVTRTSGEPGGPGGFLVEDGEGVEWQLTAAESHVAHQRAGHRVVVLNTVVCMNHGYNCGPLLREDLRQAVKDFIAGEST